MKKTIISLVILVIMSVSVMSYGGNGLGVVMPPSVFNELTQLQKEGVTYASQPFNHINEEGVTWKPVYRNGELALTKMDIVPKEKVKNIVFFVVGEDKNPYPQEVNDAMGFYNSFTVETNLKSEQIKNVRVYFKVDKKWMIEHKFSLMQVRKEHFSEDGETSSITVYDAVPYGTDDKYMIYYVDIDSFSVFYIQGQLAQEQISVEMEENQKPKLSKELNIAEVSNEVKIGDGKLIPPKEEETSNAGAWIAAFIVLALVIIGAVVYNKKNPEQNQEQQ